jgi:molybdopterin-containing oxidoreductase family membrane subunit
MMTLILKKHAGFDVGKEAIRKVAQIATYALAITLFFLLVELFTVFYSDLPEHKKHFEYLLFGLDGGLGLAPWTWSSILLAIIALVLLINPMTREKEPILFMACLATFVSVWIDKGLGLVVPGFVPSPLGEITTYVPTLLEILITAGIWGCGFLIISLLYKVVTGVRNEKDSMEDRPSG